MADYTPFFIKGKERLADIVVCCDHATNYVPDFIGDLGLDDMNSHIAYDIGALGVSQNLAEALDAPVVWSGFSRLCIDPNRGEDDPTLIMRLSDGRVIPANRGIDDAGRESRLAQLYRPYHAALAGVIKTRVNPCVISIHSFTKKLHNQPARPWDIGVLFGEDSRLADAVIARLAGLDVCVGINQPYSGHLSGDTMCQHALQNGLRHVLVEVRNDLIETETGQRLWGGRLAQVLSEAIGDINKENQNG